MFLKNIMTIFLLATLLSALTLVSAGCGRDGNTLTDSDSPDNQVFQVEVMKWYNGHRAAVCLTYDALYGQSTGQLVFDPMINEVLKRGLRLDFEFVTASFVKYPWIVTEIREKVIPRGIHFFGHGHTHILHDALGYTEAYNNFKTCFDLMTTWGLNPKVYAYPYFSGRQLTTQAANQNAGFIAARGAWTDPNFTYICPDDEIEPDNWYYLPSVPVGQETGFIQNHRAMEPIFYTTLEKRALIIYTYHAIGFPGQYGYYPMDNFLQDLDLIAGNDFWCANLDAVVCYIKERNKFHMDETSGGAVGDSLVYRITFRDELNNTVYNQPITVKFRFKPDLHIKKVVVEPSINATSEFPVADDQLLINVVPDEKAYIFKFIKR